jgi:hypothetical protein
MSLTLDSTPIDIAVWDTDVSVADGWLHALWGLRPGVSSPRPSAVRVNPDCLAGAGWLTALWGLEI